MCLNFCKTFRWQLLRRESYFRKKEGKNLSCLLIANQKILILVFLKTKIRGFTRKYVIF